MEFKIKRTGRNCNLNNPPLSPELCPTLAHHEAIRRRENGNAYVEEWWTIVAQDLCELMEILNKGMGEAIIKVNNDVMAGNYAGTITLIDDWDDLL